VPASPNQCGRPTIKTAAEQGIEVLVSARDRLLRNVRAMLGCDDAWEDPHSALLDAIIVVAFPKLDASHFMTRSRRRERP
jgi:hypothetical protein